MGTNEECTVTVKTATDQCKVQGKLITQAMNGTSVANRCNHQVLWIE